MRIVRNHDEKGNNSDKHFRELRNLETQPSPNLWDKLEYQLDEHRERVKHDHWYKALIALLIPFTVINVLITYDLADYDSQVASATKEFNGPQFPDLNEMNLSPGNPENKGGWGNFFDGFFLPQGANATETGNSIAEPKVVAPETALASAESDFLPTSLIGFETTENLASGALTPFERKVLKASVSADDMMKHRSKENAGGKTGSVKGFHFGVEGGINNRWMIHQNSSLYPLSSNRVERKLNLAATYGISAGYDFSNRFGIEAEWILQSRQGQRYYELRYGKIPVHGEVYIEYMHVPVMFKYKWTKVPVRNNYPRVLNLVTGIQYSRLHDMHIVQDGLDLSGVNELFNRNELGLLVGIEYDIFVHRNVYVSVGARASISTDAKAFPYINSENTQTCNALFGLNASVHYLAKRKTSNR